jgi:hypothetical protein
VAFLSVAGIELPCVENTWGEEPPDTLGEEVRMLSGVLGSTERTPRRLFRGDVFFDNPQDVDTFRIAISLPGSPGVPTPVPAVSPFDGVLRGASLTVHARMGRIGAFKHRTNNVEPWTTKWRFTLTLTETGG